MLRRDFRLEGIQLVPLRGAPRCAVLCGRCRCFSTYTMELRILNFESRHGDAEFAAHSRWAQWRSATVEKYSKVINVALKRATGNENISLHHARHSFADKCYDGNVSGWKEYLRKVKKLS